MQTISYEQVPLTKDDRDMLFTIYDSRRRLFFIAYLIIILIGIISSFKIDTYNSNASNFHQGLEYKLHRWEENNEDAKRISRTQMIMINIAFVETMIIGTAIYVLFTRIQPYRKDLKLGMKAKIPYTIIRKEYFPLTNQYYVGFDDPDYMHHEIDEGTYNKISEGDTMYIYRGIKSKYTFEANGRFSLM